MKLLSVDTNRSEMFQVAVELSPGVNMNMSLDYAKRHYPELFPREEAPRTTEAVFEVTLEACKEVRTKLLAKIIAQHPILVNDDIFKKIQNGPIHLNARMRSTLGRAHYLTNKIELHVRALRGHREQFEETFAHELAHLLSAAIYGLKLGRGHGRAWKQVMRVLGYEPKRTHDHDVSEFRRKRKPVSFGNCGCPGREHKFTKVQTLKALRGARWRCKACSNEIRIKMTEDAYKLINLKQG